MAGNLECPVQRERYNSTTNQPMSLPCGHTVCEVCFKRMYNGMTTCPICHQKWTGDHSIKNFGLIEAIRAMETECADHKAFAVSICMTHVVAKCQQCTHQAPDCVFKDLAEDANEVSETLNATIRATFNKLQCPKTFKAKVPQLYTMTLTDKIKFYQALNKKPCDGCKEIAETTFDISSLRYYCENCWKQISKVAVMERSPAATLADMKARVMERVYTDLKKVNSCQVNAQMFTALSSPPENFEDCVTLAQGITELAGMKLTEWSEVSDPVTCLECRVSFPKANLHMRLLPCMDAKHAICEPCAIRMTSSMGVHCPWHNSQFGIGQLDGLRKLELKSPASDGFGVPEYRQNESWPYSVNLFTTVMPPPDSQQTEWTGKNKGYTVDFSVNQVEALTFMSYRDSQLVGIGLSNPVLQGKVIGVEWVKFYVGESAQREPVWRSSVNPNQLNSGYAVVTDVYFEAPFHLSAMKNYTLKLKFQRMAPEDQQILLFRGNHLTRKENLAGDDETAWTCVQTHGVDSEERCLGQLFLTGPIIRLIYQ